MLDANTAALARHMDEVEHNEKEYEYMLEELRSLGYEKALENGIEIQYEQDFEQIVEDYGYQDIDLTIIIGDL